MRQEANELSSDERNSSKNREAAQAFSTSAEVPLMLFVFIVEEGYVASLQGL